ncbi:MAG TPA: hypothetical protein VJ835_10710 [Fimbriimonadaceae bacterium]|nr:hypothetical protein [Fimbriimonadaceae bacterium]
MNKLVKRTGPVRDEEVSVDYSASRSRLQVNPRFFEEFKRVMIRIGMETGSRKTLDIREWIDSQPNDSNQP